MPGWPTGSKRASDVVMSRIKIGRATPQDMANMLALLNTSTSTKIFADCDVVIEAITENEAVKKEVYKGLAERDSRRRHPGEQYLDDLDHRAWPSRLRIPSGSSGMHFFNPVDRMELVEVIRGEKTSDETVATIVALAKRIRKTPIVVKDCAGLPGESRPVPLHERVAHACLQEGRPMEAIDRAATKFGMPMGPIAS